VLSTNEMADGSDSDANLVASPLFHIAGLSAVITSVFAGRRIVLLPQFDAAGWLDAAETEQVTHAFVVPTMLKRIMDDPSFRPERLSSVQMLSYGAAPMPLALIRRAIQTLPSTVGFVNGFGQTETASTVTALSAADHRL